MNSFNFCSYGHKSIVNTMDCIGDTNMITGSYDKQVIYWKVIFYF